MSSRLLRVLCLVATLGAVAYASQSGARPAEAQSLNVSLTASASSVPVGTAVTFTATVSGDTSKISGPGIEIHHGIDIYTGPQEGVCGSDTNTCTGQWTQSTAGTSQFIAQFWSFYSGRVLAKSAIVSVTWTAVATPTATAAPTRTPLPSATPAKSTPSAGVLVSGNETAIPSNGGTTNDTAGGLGSDSGGTPWAPAAAVVGGTAAVAGGTVLLRRRRVPGLAGGTPPATWPPIIDAEGNPLPTQDGTFGGGGAPGDVWYGGAWVPRDVAQRAIIEDRQALDQRAREAGEFTAGTDAERTRSLQGQDTERAETPVPGAEPGAASDGQKAPSLDAPCADRLNNVHAVSARAHALQSSLSNLRELYSSLDLQWEAVRETSYIDSEASLVFAAGGMWGKGIAQALGRYPEQVIIDKIIESTLKGPAQQMVKQYLRTQAGARADFVAIMQAPSTSAAKKGFFEGLKAYASDKASELGGPTIPGPDGSLLHRNMEPVVGPIVDQLENVFKVNDAAQAAMKGHRKLEEIRGQMSRIHDEIAAEEDGLEEVLHELDLAQNLYNLCVQHQQVLAVGP